MKTKYAAGAVAALVLAAFVGAATALATAGLIDDDGERQVRAGEPRFVPGFGERMLDDRATFGPGRPLRFEGWLDLEAAASYLGVGVEELHDELADGNSLADVARDEGKSVDGLVQSLVEVAGERIDDAVADGRVTEEQADELKDDLDERIEDRVNDAFRFAKPFSLDHDFEWPRSRRTG